MPKEIVLRRRFMANWFVLCVNILLLAILVVSWMVWLVDRPETVARKDARALGMDVYCERSPFAVLVNKDFPDKKEFTFFRYDLPVLVLTSGDVTEPSQALPDGDHHKKAQVAEEVMLGFGPEGSFSVSFVCSADGVHVEDLLVSRDEGGRSEAFLDFNANGFPDLRLIFDQKQDVRSAIWYGGKWQEVLAEGKKYERQLVGGEKMRFDRQAGLWVLAGDANAGGHKESSGETHPPKR